MKIEELDIKIEDELTTRKVVHIEEYFLKVDLENLLAVLKKLKSSDLFDTIVIKDRDLEKSLKVLDVIKEDDFYGFYKSKNFNVFYNRILKLIKE